MATHTPVRRWWTLWLHRGCTCGRWAICPPSWAPPERIPDGDRVPWPTNDRPAWADGPTRELNARPFLTPGQEYRGRGGWWRA